MGQKSKKPPHYVREWRLFKGWDQEKLAGLVGLQRAAISKIETGAKPLMEHRLWAFAQAFNIQIPQLFERPPNQMGGEFDMLVRRLSSAKLNAAKEGQIAKVLSALLDDDEPAPATKKRA